MNAPLVPCNLDLADFQFMPFEFDRLFQSETWVLSNDAEKVAALTLWGKAWREVPAGSLPNNDRMLAHLSGAGPRWKRLKAMALRGWMDGGDGRLYHPVVCEKALEAWIEKLTSRVVGGVGNATRWGGEFDPEPLIAEISNAREMLKALNPNSRTLRKPIPKGQKKSPAGNPNGTPDLIPTGSQGTGTGTGTVEARAEDPPHPRITTEAARACRLMREAGCAHVNPANPNLIAALELGITGETLAQYAAIAVANGKTSPFAYAIAAARGDHRQPQPGARHAHGTHPRRLSAVERVEANIRRRRIERGELDPGDVIDGTATRVPR